MRDRLSRRGRRTLPAAVAATLLVGAGPAAAAGPSECRPGDPVTPMAIEGQDFANRLVGPVFEPPAGMNRIR